MCQVSPHEEYPNLICHTICEKAACLELPTRLLAVASHCTQASGQTPALDEHSQKFVVLGGGRNVHCQ